MNARDIIVLFAVVACAAFVVADVNELVKEKKEPIAIVRSESNKNEDGSYNFEYEGADGTVRQEAADIVDVGTDNQALRITGSYKYIDANGEEVVVNYTADENGFVPIGTHIPKEISDNAQAARDLPSVYEPDDSTNVPPYA